jgi:hypothetical protein
MKKVLLLGLALLFVSSAVSAQQLALYNDVDRTTFSVLGVESGNMVRVYLYVNPPADGLTCIEHGMLAEGGAFMPFQPVYHPNVAQPVLAAGFPTGDTGGCWSACMNEGWVYFCYADLFIQSASPIYLSIRPFQGPPVQAWPKILTCTGCGAPEYEDPCEVEAYVLNNFCINDICEVSVEESSWGAIKNLYE